MSAGTKIIYAMLVLLLPPVAVVILYSDERIPKWVTALAALWCALLLIILLAGGSCRAPVYYDGTQLY